MKFEVRGSEVPDKKIWVTSVFPTILFFILFPFFLFCFICLESRNSGFSNFKLVRIPGLHSIGNCNSTEHSLAEIFKDESIQTGEKE